MRFSTALGLSVAAHAVLAAAIVGIIKWNPGPTAEVQLDLSSVELSFAEEEVEDAPAVAIPDVAPLRAAPPPIEEMPPPVAAMQMMEMPPDFEAMPLPAPSEDPPMMDMDILEPEKSKQAVQEKSEQNVQDKSPQTQQSSEPALVVPAPKQARIDMSQKNLQKMLKKEYPAGARRRGEQGVVVVRVHIGTDGTVRTAELVDPSKYAELNVAAVKMAEKVPFVPAYREGKPVESVVNLPLQFKLTN